MSNLGTSFGTAAGAYQRGRPEYPAEAVAWLAQGATRAADVGAGTGKLTAGLLPVVKDVVAIDPDPQMLAELHQHLPGVPTFVGSAEHLPLPDASVDLVTFGQAWHWVDPPAASAEAARVLRPGGTLGLIWNVRDESDDVVARLTAIMRASVAEQMVHGAGPTWTEPFGEAEEFTLRWSRPLTPRQVHDMVVSRSYVIAQAPHEREQTLARIADLLATHPATAGQDLIEMPYITQAYRVRRP